MYKYGQPNPDPTITRINLNRTFPRLRIHATGPNQVATATNESIIYHYQN